MINHKRFIRQFIPAKAIKIVRQARTIIVALSRLEAESAASLAEHAESIAKHYPSICSVDDLVRKYKSLPGLTDKSLDLGCGMTPRNPFEARETFGVDIRGDLAADIKQADLATEPIPFEDDFFDFCTAFDVIEHIPRNSWRNSVHRFGFLELMNQIHRILKPGGLFLHLTPAFPSKEAFQDPTHVNIITEDTMPLYFCKPSVSAKHYGFNGSFELIEQRWIQGVWLAGIMKANK